jgi:hypothetical protein
MTTIVCPLLARNRFATLLRIARWLRKRRSGRLKLFPCTLPLTTSQLWEDGVAFADVYKLQSKVDGRLYAVKLNRQPFRGRPDRDPALSEVRANQSSTHIAQYSMDQAPCCASAAFLHERFPLVARPFGLRMIIVGRNGLTLSSHDAINNRRCRISIRME